MFPISSFVFAFKFSLSSFHFHVFTFKFSLLCFHSQVVTLSIFTRIPEHYFNAARGENLFKVRQDKKGIGEGEESDPPTKKRKKHVTFNFQQQTNSRIGVVTPQSYNNNMKYISMFLVFCYAVT